MKRSHNEINSSSEDRNTKVRVGTHQVTITLDQSIESNLLYHKFRIQTTELQLFLQYVPILYWYPLEVIGSINFKYNIDECVFSAAVRNPLHQYRSRNLIKQLTTRDLITKLINKLEYYGQADSDMKVIESIQNFIMKENQDLKKSKLNSLLESLLNDKLFIDKINREIDERSILSQNKNQYHYDRIYKSWTYPGHYTEDAKHSETMKDDEEIGLQVIKHNADGIRFLSDRLQNDEQFILKAIKQNYRALCYAPDRFTDNEEIVLETIKQNAKAFKDASNRLRSDEQFILRAVKANGLVLGYESYMFISDPNTIQDNEEIILEAIKQNGTALVFASKRLQDNEKFVLEAITRDGLALNYASNRLRDNEQIVLEAVKQNGNALQYASKRLRNNEAIVIEAIKHDDNGEAFNFASERFQDNEEVALQAVKQCGRVFLSLSDRLQDNELMLFEAVKTDSLVLRYAPDRLKDNEKIVFEAVKHDDQALSYAPNRLRSDFNFTNEIFKCCNSLLVFQYIEEELRNIELIYHFIENHQSRFHELMRKNKCLVL